MVKTYSSNVETHPIKRTRQAIIDNTIDLGIREQDAGLRDSVNGLVTAVEQARKVFERAIEKEKQQKRVRSFSALICSHTKPSAYEVRKMNNKNEYDLYKMVKENYNINRDDIYIKDILV